MGTYVCNGNTLSLSRERIILWQANYCCISLGMLCSGTELRHTNCKVVIIIISSSCHYIWIWYDLTIRSAHCHLPAWSTGKILLYIDSCTEKKIKSTYYDSLLGDVFSNLFPEACDFTAERWNILKVSEPGRCLNYPIMQSVHSILLCDSQYLIKIYKSESLHL